MNNLPPLREPFQDGKPTEAWANWFQQVFAALVGWNAAASTSVTNDFGAIGAGAVASLAVTVAGVRAGATVLVAPSLKTTGIVYEGIVTADNTVTLYAQNVTSGSINPASTTFQITVLQK